MVEFTGDNFYGNFPGVEDCRHDYICQECRLDKKAANQNQQWDSASCDVIGTFVKLLFNGEVGSNYAICEIELFGLRGKLLDK